MVLLLGNSDDALVNAVLHILNARGVPVQQISEPELFASAPFAFEQRARTFTASLHLNNLETQLQDLSGVLVRLPRSWSPPPDFDLQDQVFIYHESNAAWFALISGLRCSMVNRPSLAWWVHDLTYPETITQQLATRLALSLAASPLPPAGLGRLFPTRPPVSPHSASFYAVDGALIPCSADHLPFAPQIPASRLEAWQKENGLRFCRLDFVCDNHVPKLTSVDVYPLLDDEPASVVDKVALAITEVLS